MAATKKAKAPTTKKPNAQGPRKCFAGYPSADAFEIQYEVLRDEKGKPQYEFKDKERKVLKLDDQGEKIPVLNKDQPLRDKDGQEVLKKAKKNGQLPWGFALEHTGVTKVWKEKGKEVKYAACKRFNAGGFQRVPVWIREDQLQFNQCLEVVFIDIGQGDGCFLITPDDKKIVIDAGQRGNMRHYLNWRYGSGSRPGPDGETVFEAAIISHPDSDHYQGFEQLFERDNFFFETVYTNGLMERLEPEKKGGVKKAGEPKQTPLGPVQKVNGVEYVTDLVTSLDELKAFLAIEKNWVSKESPRNEKDEKLPKKKNGKTYPTMLNEAFEGWKKILTKDAGKDLFWEKRDKTMRDFQMLSVDNGYLPGYEPQPGRDLTIQVLGPVTARDSQGRKMLEWLDGNVSKTKNGHSVVLRLQYRNVSLMLGGDLNIPSEELLLKHHTGMSLPTEATTSPQTQAEKDYEAKFLEAARRVFQVDIAKSCHHGSSDFSHWFLRALNPIATVISSGDDEPHSHPRSDTLGAVGNFSRCNPRPLIFSTELARSTKDSLQKPHELRADILKDVEKIAAAPSGTPEEKRARDDLMEKLKDKLKVDIDRSVAVYGAITVVTDGVKAIIYQKLERSGSHGDYDMYRLEPQGKDGTGPLMFKSKH